MLFSVVRNVKDIFQFPWLAWNVLFFCSIRSCSHHLNGVRSDMYGGNKSALKLASRSHRDPWNVVSSLHSKWRIHKRIRLFYVQKIYRDCLKSIKCSNFNAALLRTLFIRIKNINFLTGYEIYLTYMIKFAKNAWRDLRMAYNYLLEANRQSNKHTDRNCLYLPP